MVLLTRSGEVAFQKDGDVQPTAMGGAQHAVRFSPAELAPFAGRTHLLTHNHPTDSSLTLDDAMVMAFLNVEEGNAFRHDVRYRLIRLVEHWPAPDDLRRAFARLDREVRLVLGALVRARRMTPQDAAAAHLHAVWTRFADERQNEYAYVRERR